MGKKKDRERFTIKFNEKDPTHAEVIRLLEQQGPHSKAQFIANAILHYIHCPETPDISVLRAVDRESVESIVLEILKQQGIEKTEKKPVIQKEVMKIPDRVGQKHSSGPDTGQMDDEMMTLIASTMSAFRNG